MKRLELGDDYKSSDTQDSHVSGMTSDGDSYGDSLISDEEGSNPDGTNEGMEPPTPGLDADTNTVS